MYAILCKNGNLVISNYRLNWNVPLLKDYGQVKNGEIPWMYEDKLKIIKITIFDKIKLYDFDRWFENCENLVEVDGLENIDVSECEYMSFVFNGCKNLTTILDLTSWNMFNCKDFTNMFGWCECLRLVYLPSTLRKVNIDMFDGCNNNLKIHWKNHFYTYEDLLEYEDFTD